MLFRWCFFYINTIATLFFAKKLQKFGTFYGISMKRNQLPPNYIYSGADDTSSLLVIPRGGHSRYPPIAAHLSAKQPSRHRSLSSPIQEDYYSSPKARARSFGERDGPYSIATFPPNRVGRQTPPARTSTPVNNRPTSSISAPDTSANIIAPIPISSISFAEPSKIWKQAPQPTVTPSSLQRPFHSASNLKLDTSANGPQTQTRPRIERPASEETAVRDSLLQDFGSQPFQNYLQYQQFQERADMLQNVKQSQDQLHDHQNDMAEMQMKVRQNEQQVKDYKQKNHPMNLNDYLIKVIVSPKEIKVLESSAFVQSDKFDTTTINSTSPNSVLIQQLSGRLKTFATGAIGDCPPRVENIATYLRTVQYHLRNKADSHFWSFFADTSSSGSLSSCYVEEFQDARPLVNQNKSRVNPAQLWYEARRACSDLDWTPEGIQHLFYLFVTDVVAQNYLPSEILVIVHEGREAQEKPTNGERETDLGSWSNTEALNASRNRASQNLEKVLQEYLETEKKLASTSIFNGTGISNSDVSTDPPYVEESLYDPTLKEFESYMTIPPPVPEKDVRYLSSVLNKARQIRRNLSIRSSKFRNAEDLNTIDDSTNHENSLISSQSETTLPTKLTYSNISSHENMLDHSSVFSFTQEKDSVLDISLAGTAGSSQSQNTSIEAKPPSQVEIPPPRSESKASGVLRFRRWLTRLFTSRKSKKLTTEQSTAAVLSRHPKRVLSPTPEHTKTTSNKLDKPIADKYLLTHLDVIDSAISPHSSSSSGSRRSSNEQQRHVYYEHDRPRPFTAPPRRAPCPPSITPRTRNIPYNTALGIHDMRRESILDPRSVPSYPRVPMRSHKHFLQLPQDVYEEPRRPSTSEPAFALSDMYAPRLDFEDTMHRSYSSVYPTGAYTPGAGVGAVLNEVPTDHLAWEEPLSAFEKSPVSSTHSLLLSLAAPSKLSVIPPYSDDDEW